MDLEFNETDLKFVKLIGQESTSCEAIVAFAHKFVTHLENNRDVATRSAALPEAMFFEMMFFEMKRLLKENKRIVGELESLDKPGGASIKGVKLIGQESTSCEAIVVFAHKLHMYITTQGGSCLNHIRCSENRSDETLEQELAKLIEKNISIRKELSEIEGVKK